ncbi:MAG TPA: HDOD domain-containing protein [Tepidisphaeraceae bacterium]|jgi:HD-like signal output (HDOD) protein|nr:HDOD domain-containing protein [Tepidisphaeraceae bacterium]
MPTAIAADQRTIARDAIKNITALATLPEVTAQIIATVEDPRSSIGKLHKIIATDPSLSARILKVINSAFYGVSGQIGSVERAIVLLGLNAVKNIAVAASLGQLFRGVKLGEEFTARDLWTHCISVGVAARELARSLRIPVPDEAFVAGLMHDAGILVELQIWPEKLQCICTTAKRTGADFCETERQILGVDHSALGQALTEQWHFPAYCQQVAGFHHNPSGATESDRMLVGVVYIADILCCQCGQGFNLTATGQQFDPAVLSNLNVDSGQIEALKNSLDENITNALAVFS